MDISIFPTILVFCLLVLVMFYCMLDIYFGRKAKYDNDKFERAAKILEVASATLLKKMDKPRDENKD